MLKYTGGGGGGGGRGTNARGHLRTAMFDIRSITSLGGGRIRPSVTWSSHVGHQHSMRRNIISNSRLRVGSRVQIGSNIPRYRT